MTPGHTVWKWNVHPGWSLPGTLTSASAHTPPVMKSLRLVFIPHLSDRNFIYTKKWHALFTLTSWSGFLLLYTPTNLSVCSYNGRRMQTGSGFVNIQHPPFILFFIKHTLTSFSLTCSTCSLKLNQCHHLGIWLKMWPDRNEITFPRLFIVSVRARWEERRQQT